MLAAIFFTFGTIIGSFLNVAICRLPSNNSVADPASHCPHCNHRLMWHELIPLFSYLFLRGKCRYCGTAISPQYPAVELATGFIYVGLYVFFGLKIKLAMALLFVSLLIPLIIIDVRHQIIPDTLNGAGAAIGILAIFASDITFFDAVLGACIGGSVLLLVAVVSRGGMGGGDIKMMAWMGLVLGWKMTLVALFLSFISGGLGSLLLILSGVKKRKDFIPFGPFLAIGGFTAYMFGHELLMWYLKTYFT